MPQRGEFGRQLPLRGPLKALEADIHHANAMVDVYADGDSSVSTYERRASLREFYAIIYPILQQLQSSLIERDLKGKGRCKDIVSRKRMEDWRKICNKDVEREDECGICLETCTKMVLPNCSHAMCIKCYRDCSIKDQNLAHSAEGASKEFAQETFGCLQITMMSLTLLL
ncbi:hypothetical protein ACP70R_022827 [Stipagrostis hirtigluma subsp. patula]